VETQINVNVYASLKIFGWSSPVFSARHPIMEAASKTPLSVPTCLFGSPERALHVMLYNYISDGYNENFPAATENKFESEI
jgi:hypothetical protein